MKLSTSLVAVLVSTLVATSASAAPISPMDGYQASEHSDYDLNSFWSEVSRMDSRMKGKDCFKRAMLWSYQLNQKYGVETKKVFMHYTDKFNHELDDQGRTGIAARLGRLFSSNDGWDFHVAPVVNIEGQDLVLDPYMRNQPESIEDWVDYLSQRGESLLKKRHRDLLKDLRKYSKRARSRHARSSDIEKVQEIKATLANLNLSESSYGQSYDIKCKKITHIMEFDRAQQTEWCFYQETSMYYYGPLELRYLNYGNIAWDKRLPVTDMSFHNENSYADGRNYVVRDWDYEKLESSLDEYKQEYKPDSLGSL